MLIRPIELKDNQQLALAIRAVLIEMGVPKVGTAYEDKEFYIRVKREFSNNLYLVPEAKLYHYHSIINRNSLIDKYERDLIEVFKIYKKNIKTYHN